MISGISTEMNSIINKLFSEVKCLPCKASMDKMMHCVCEDPWTDTFLLGTEEHLDSCRWWSLFHSHTHTGTLTGGSSIHTLSKGKWMPFYHRTAFIIKQLHFYKKVRNETLHLFLVLLSESLVLLQSFSGD